MITFVAVYDRHAGRVFRYFAYRVRSREQAEDLTQMTFERALRAWSRYDPARSSARTWLLAIAHNLLVDHFRADRTGNDVALEAAANVQGPPPVPDLGLEPELAAAIETLTQRDREVLALRFGADLNGPEIAQVTGLSVANVQQILSRSLRRLREQLDGDMTPAEQSS